MDRGYFSWIGGRWQSWLGASMLLGLGALGSCSSSGSAAAVEPECTYGPQCEGDDIPKEPVVVESSADPPAVSASVATNSLCAGACNPDDELACTDDGSSSADDAEDGGVAGGGAGSDSGAKLRACHIVATNSGQQVQCAPAGSGEVAAPCLSSEDCAPGYGCVGPQGMATCRRFCCEDPESCEPGTYCAERVVRSLEANALSVAKAPVCVAPVLCRLDEPYPCLDQATCECAAGTACMVVRADGTTDCVTPGTGLAGDECPCAAGHVCSKGTNACLKICKTNNLTEPQCDEGLCQASQELPEGYGTCVGEAPDAG